MAVQAELEVLVLKLEATSEPTAVEESVDTNKSGKNSYVYVGVFLSVFNVLHEIQEHFFFVLRIRCQKKHISALFVSHRFLVI